MVDREGKPPACPECGSDEIVPIAYGLPGPELRKEAERGDVELGGCVIADDDPQWHCKKCRYRWA